VDEALRLSSILSVGIVGCVRPVPLLHQPPINEVIAVEYLILICELGVRPLCMTVTADHCVARCTKCLRGAHHVDDLLGTRGFNAYLTACYRKEHGAARSEVERYVVGEGAAGPTWHRAVGPTILDMAVADLHPIDRTLQHSVVWKQAVPDHARDPLDARHV